MAELPASKLQRQADAAPSWGAELERLLRTLGDDEELLDEASHALQAATTGAAFDASPAVAALVRHCDTPSRRGEVASRVFYLEQDVQQRAAHVAATQQAEEIDDLIQRTDVIDVTAESSSDDEAPPAAAQDSDEDGFEFVDPPAADDDAALARRIQADERRAERERIRREEADAEFARRLAEDPGRVVIDVEQIVRDEQLARRLSEAAPATPGALEPVSRVTPTHLGTRRLRVGLPGGQAVTFELEETQPLSMIFPPLCKKLGLDAHDDPYSTYVLAQGEKRYKRPELLMTVGAACGSHRRVRFRVERRDLVGHIVMGRGSFASAPTIFRLTAHGRPSAIIVVRDPFGDSGLRIAKGIERYAVTVPQQQRRADLKAAALNAGTKAAKAIREWQKAKRREEQKTREDDPEHRTATVRYLETATATVRASGGNGSIALAERGTSSRRYFGRGGHLAGAPAVPDEFKSMAGEVIDMAERAVLDPSYIPRSGPSDNATRMLAARALQNQHDYYMCQGLTYGRSASLPNHIDGVGHWVVLFSLGNGCTFNVGTGLAGSGGMQPDQPTDSFTFRSGDALVFNGDPRHVAIHGMDRVHENTSPAALPRWLQNIRASVQVRQM
jgi:hypothetical protein